MTFYIFDGTGSSGDKEYAQEMSNGFCKQLEKETKGTYYRGPGTIGWSTFEPARQAYAAIISNRTKPSHGFSSRLFLAGHSRGGAAAIFLAQKLKDANINVASMYLFDAVDRTFGYDLDKISTNVGKCYHARRDRSLAKMFEQDKIKALADWDDCLRKHPNRQRQECTQLGHKYSDLAEQDSKMKLAMRAEAPAGGILEYPTIDFGNCGTTGTPNGYVEKFFSGSHGAMGGAPIIDSRAPRKLINIDNVAMNSVRSWMWGNMIRDGALQAEMA